MHNTREALKNLPRPVRPVPLPGGGTLHVRDVSIAELRRVDQNVGQIADEDDKKIRFVLLVCAYALCSPEGIPLFPPEPSEEDLAEIEALTPKQLDAVVTAAIPSKAEAKNG